MSKSREQPETSPIIKDAGMASTAILSSSVTPPQLTRTDSESIPLFLRSYDIYTHAVKRRAQSFALDESKCLLVALKYCVDSEYTVGAIELGFLIAEDYDSIDDPTLRAYLDSKATKSTDNVSVQSLDNLARRELKMNMTDTNATHVLSAIRPEVLRMRLELDLNLGHKDLNDDLTAFVKHAVRLAGASQLLDIGSRSDKPRTDGQSNRGIKGSKSTRGSSSSRSTRELPVCPFPPHQSKGIRHLLKDCRACSEDERKVLLAQWAADRDKDGPSQTTRAKSKNSSSDPPRTIGRIYNKAEGESSCAISLIDGETIKNITGRCDDGSDESIVSSRIAESAAINGIGRITRIAPVELSVALKSKQEEPQLFCFSRTWTCPRTVLHLSAGQLALRNISYLVPDDDLGCEDLLIGLPVLRHLRIDTKTLFEQNRARLDESDCANVTASQTKRLGDVGRLMINSTNQTATNQPELDPEHPTVNYYTSQREEDIKISVKQLLKSASINGLPDEHAAELRSIVEKHFDKFRTTFSAGPPASVAPLKVNLSPDARPVRVRLRHYSSEQREFLQSHVAELERCGMIYLNPTATWASAPLLFSKPGPARFRFTVDLRPVNKFTLVDQ